MRIPTLPGPRRNFAPMLAALALIVIVRAAASAADPAPAAAPAPAAPAATDTPTKTTDKLSPIELFQKGGFFMYPLAACSILSVALIIERFVALRRSRIIPPGFVAGLKAIFHDPREDRERALEYCAQSDTPLARMIAAGLRRLPRGYTATEKAIEDAGGNEALKLRQNMRFLYSLGSVATLLGLIGTILGMIRAFHEVAASGSAGNAEKLSTGIYEAMVNTFGGLAVAIVVTIFYYFFVGRIERLIYELNDAIMEFGDDIGFDVNPDEEAAVTARL